jgi:hypothetical protein
MKTRPNQGLWLSVRNALRVGGGFGLIIGLMIGLLGGAGNGLSYGFLSGLCAGLWYGGLDVLQHGIVRLLLYFRGDAPLNYDRFLDYAADELNFLQKVGGYVFIHRYLLASHRPV